MAICKEVQDFFSSLTPRSWSRFAPCLPLLFSYTCVFSSEHFQSFHNAVMFLCRLFSSPFLARFYYSGYNFPSDFAFCILSLPLYYGQAYIDFHSWFLCPFYVFLCAALDACSVSVVNPFAAHCLWKELYKSSLLIETADMVQTTAPYKRRVFFSLLRNFSVLLKIHSSQYFILKCSEVFL